MSRRGKAEIVKDILELCKTPMSKTDIVYKCNLNFKIVKKYLTWCFIHGWLQKKEDKYITTHLGNDYYNLLLPVVENIQF